MKDCELLQQIDEDTLGAIPFSAVAIKKSREGRTHCGIVYRRGTDELCFLHLGWHFRLMLDQSAALEKGYALAELNIEPVDQKYVAAFCDVVATERPNIPYGISSKGVQFEAETGKLILENESAGLTCATFVLAVLEAQGLNLLRREEWPSGTNGDWAEWVIASLKEDSSVSREYIAMMERDAAAVQRFKPEEVAGSAPMPEWPVAYLDASAAGDEVFASLL